jgi:hypothetical protein
MPRVPGNEPPPKHGGRAAERLRQFEQARGVQEDPGEPAIETPAEEPAEETSGAETKPEPDDEDEKGPRDA